MMTNNHKAPPEHIPTRDLIIRRYVIEDSLALHDSIATSIEHLRPWMAWIKHEPMTIHQREALISQWNTNWHEGSEYTMGGFLNEVFVGSAGLHFRGEPDVVEIGYWIDIRHVRRGYAAQIVESLTNLAFETWSYINRVEIHVDANNGASQSVAERTGFQKHGTSVRNPLAPGESGTMLHWATKRKTNS